MADKKTIKRDAKAIWDVLKQERRARAKLHSGSELAESARRIAAQASELEALAKRVKVIEASAPANTNAKVADLKKKKKPKTKPKRESKTEA